MGKRRDEPRHLTEGAVRLRQWLKDNNVTQAEFARRLDSHQSNVSEWLSGLTRPQKSTLKRIRDATDIPILAWASLVEAEDDAA